MKILFISYYFPPYQAIGAVRTGKIAKYLHQAGVDLRVVTAANQSLPSGLQLEIPQELVTSTTWINMNAPAEFFSGTKKTDVIASGYPRASGIKKVLIDLYKNFFHFPDAEIGWLWAAEKAASELIKQQKPDLIYASASPYTSLIIASRLSKKHSIPWFGELRDLWMDNPYVNKPWLRTVLEARLEKSVLSSAKGLISVSEQMVKTLSSKYQVPTKVIKNGFDVSDYENIPHDPVEQNHENIQIAYMGSIYEGKRDPSPLFEAISNMGAEKEHFFIDFYGRYNSSIHTLVKKFGLENQIRIHEPVNFQESLRIQKNSDILLLLTWDNPADYGVYTGKFFEYLAVKRPIIGLGSTENVALDYIHKNKIGYAGNQVQEIMNYLQDMRLLKIKEAGIPDNNVEISEFSRVHQVQDLLGFLGSNYA